MLRAPRTTPPGATVIGRAGYIAWQMSEAWAIHLLPTLDFDRQTIAARRDEGVGAATVEHREVDGSAAIESGAFGRDLKHRGLGSRCCTAPTEQYGDAERHREDLHWRITVNASFTGSAADATGHGWMRPNHSSI